MVFGYSTNQFIYTVECKSWTPDGIAFRKFINGEGNAYKQFKTYLQSLTTLDGLEYWFEGRKASEIQAKQKFQEMMYQNNALTQQGTEVFNVIWANGSLRRSLFVQPPGSTLPQWESIARNDFTSLIANLDDKFFRFINDK